MLEYLITSKTRLKLILKFFINTNTEAYLRGLAEEFGESTNSVRVELNRFEKAGLIEAREFGRKKLFKANQNHNLFKEIHTIVTKFIGIDQLVEEIVSKLGDVQAAYIVGDYAKGIDSGEIELVIIGSVDHDYLQTLVVKTEKLIKRKIKIRVREQKEEVTLDETVLTVWGQ